MTLPDIPIIGPILDPILNPPKPTPVAANGEVKGMGPAAPANTWTAPPGPTPPAPPPAPASSMHDDADRVPYTPA